MIFEHALNQWCHWVPSVENHFTAVCRIDNVHQFVKIIQEGVMLQEDKVVQIGMDETHYLVTNKWIIYKYINIWGVYELNLHICNDRYWIVQKDFVIWDLIYYQYCYDYLKW